MKNTYSDTQPVLYTVLEVAGFPVVPFCRESRFVSAFCLFVLYSVCLSFCCVMCCCSSINPLRRVLSMFTMCNIVYIVTIAIPLTRRIIYFFISLLKSSLASVAPAAAWFPFCFTFSVPSFAPTPTVSLAD